MLIKKWDNTERETIRVDLENSEEDMPFITITCLPNADGIDSIALYTEDIDNLIIALREAKEELRISE